MTNYHLMPAKESTNYLNENFSETIKNLKNLEITIIDDIKYFNHHDLKNICTDIAWRNLSANVVTTIFVK